VTRVSLRANVDCVVQQLVLGPVMATRCLRRPHPVSAPNSRVLVGMADSPGHGSGGVRFREEQRAADRIREMRRQNEAEDARRAQQNLPGDASSTDGSEPRQRRRPRTKLTIEAPTNYKNMLELFQAKDELTSSAAPQEVTVPFEMFVSVQERLEHYQARCTELNTAHRKAVEELHDRKRDAESAQKRVRELTESHALLSGRVDQLMLLNNDIRRERDARSDEIARLSDVCDGLRSKATEQAKALTCTMEQLEEANTTVVVKQKGIENLIHAQNALQETNKAMQRRLVVAMREQARAIVRGGAATRAFTEALKPRGSRARLDAMDGESDGVDEHAGSDVQPSDQKKGSAAQLRALESELDHYRNLTDMTAESKRNCARSMQQRCETTESTAMELEEQLQRAMQAVASTGAREAVRFAEERKTQLYRDGQLLIFARSAAALVPAPAFTQEPGFPKGSAFATAWAPAKEAAIKTNSALQLIADVFSRFADTLNDSLTLPELKERWASFFPRWRQDCEGSLASASEQLLNTLKVLVASEKAATDRIRSQVEADYEQRRVNARAVAVQTTDAAQDGRSEPASPGSFTSQLSMRNIRGQPDSPTRSSLSLPTRNTVNRMMQTDDAMWRKALASPRATPVESHGALIRGPVAVGAAPVAACAQASDLGTNAVALPPTRRDQLTSVTNVQGATFEEGSSASLEAKPAKKPTASASRKPVEGRGRGPPSKRKAKSTNGKAQAGTATSRPAATKGARRTASAADAAVAGAPSPSAVGQDPADTDGNGGPTDDPDENAPESDDSEEADEDVESMPSDRSDDEGHDEEAVTAAPTLEPAPVRAPNDEPNREIALVTGSDAPVPQPPAAPRPLHRRNPPPAPGRVVTPPEPATAPPTRDEVDMTVIARDISSSHRASRYPPAPPSRERASNSRATLEVSADEMATFRPPANRGDAGPTVVSIYGSVPVLNDELRPWRRETAEAGVQVDRDVVSELSRSVLSRSATATTTTTATTQTTAAPADQVVKPRLSTSTQNAPEPFGVETSASRATARGGAAVPPKRGARTNATDKPTVQPRTSAPSTDFSPVTPLTMGARVERISSAREENPPSAQPLPIVAPVEARTGDDVPPDLPPVLAVHEHRGVTPDWVSNLLVPPDTLRADEAALFAYLPERWFAVHNALHRFMADVRKRLKILTPLADPTAFIGDGGARTIADVHCAMHFDLEAINALHLLWIDLKSNRGGSTTEGAKAAKAYNAAITQMRLRQVDAQCTTTAALRALPIGDRDELARYRAERAKEATELVRRRVDQDLGVSASLHDATHTALNSVAPSHALSSTAAGSRRGSVGGVPGPQLPPQRTSSGQPPSYASRADVPGPSAVTPFSSRSPVPGMPRINSDALPPISLKDRLKSHVVVFTADHDGAVTEGDEAGPRGRVPPANRFPSGHSSAALGGRALPPALAAGAFEGRLGLPAVTRSWGPGSYSARLSSLSGTPSMPGTNAAEGLEDLAVGRKARPGQVSTGKESLTARVAAHSTRRGSRWGYM
jgi:hypothetical protein